MFNSLAPGKFGNNFKSIIFELNMQSSSLGTMWNCSQLNATEAHYWQVNIGSGNGNKLLPESVFTGYKDLCGHMASLGQNELNKWYFGQ